MKAFRDIRILPVVLAAIGGLAVLKVSGLVIDGGYVLAERSERVDRAGLPKRSWAQEALNFPGAGDPADITGSMPSAPKSDAPKPPSGPALKPPDAVRPAEQIAQPADQGPVINASERAVLERLQTRRQELEARAREIDIRENLLKSAEKRIEAKVEEMRASEARLASASEQRTQTDSARLKAGATVITDVALRRRRAIRSRMARLTPAVMP